MDPAQVEYLDEILNERMLFHTQGWGILGITTATHAEGKPPQKLRIKDTLYEKNDPAAAVVSINPANGAIRAMTSVYPGRSKNQFNLVAQARRQALLAHAAYVGLARMPQDELAHPLTDASPDEARRT